MEASMRIGRLDIHTSWRGGSAWLGVYLSVAGHRLLAVVLDSGIGSSDGHYLRLSTTTGLRRDCTGGRRAARTHAVRFALGPTWRTHHAVCKRAEGGSRFWRSLRAVSARLRAVHVAAQRFVDQRPHYRARRPGRSAERPRTV